MIDVSVKNQRGTAAIESLVSLTFVISLVSGGITIAYFSFAKVWLDRVSYEALICLSTTSSEATCDRDLRASASRLLPLGSLSAVHLHRTPNEARIDLRYSFRGQVLIHHRASLHLPLIAGGGLQ